MACFCVTGHNIYIERERERERQRARERAHSKCAYLFTYSRNFKKMSRCNTFLKPKLSRELNVYVNCIVVTANQGTALDSSAAVLVATKIQIYILRNSLAVSNLKR